MHVSKLCAAGVWLVLGFLTAAALLAADDAPTTAAAALATFSAPAGEKAVFVKPSLLDGLRQAQPDIILIGNSMQGKGIDFPLLSRELGLKVFNAEHGGAMTIWHYGVMRYALPKLAKQPRMVLIVERKNHFTCPQMRARDYQAKSKELAGDEDWSLLQRLAINGEGQPAWQKNWDGMGIPLDNFYWDFEKAVRWSLLPHMIDLARQGGYQLVVVRHKARAFAEKPDWYPPEMQKYGDDMAYYLQANGVPFLDFDRLKALEWDVYANGDHLSAEGKQIWTDRMVADLKALLAGKTAPDQHLPPADYKPSSDLAAISAHMPALPEPPPPPPAEAAPKAAAKATKTAKAATTRPATASAPAKGGTTTQQAEQPVNRIKNIESIIYFGEGLRGRGITLAVAMLPGRETSLRAYKNSISKTDIGAVPLDLTDAFSQVADRSELYSSATTLSPKGVQFVAGALAEMIPAKFPFMALPLQVYDASPAVAATKDGRELTINQVHLARSKEFLQPSRQTRLVLVGDRNVGLYSDPALGMGEHAGLGEHLSKALGRPLQWRWRSEHPRDAILKMLDEINLDQTTVVVWVFMHDDLNVKQWGRIPVPQIKEFQQPDRLVVTARIAKKSPAPEPDVKEKYPDTVNYTLWQVQKVLEGDWTDKELLTVEWSQKDMDFLPPFRYAEGDEFTLELVPLKAAIKQDRSIRKADFVDAVDRHDLPPFWIVGGKKE